MPRTEFATAGVEGAKPRLTIKEARADSARRMARIRVLNEAYLTSRNRQIDLKTLKAAMELAKERGELISRREFELRLGFYMTRVSS